MSDEFLSDKVLLSSQQSIDIYKNKKKIIYVKNIATVNASPTINMKIKVEPMNGSNFYQKVLLPLITNISDEISCI